MTVDRRIRHGALVLLSVVGASGCGGPGPNTHPVAGRVQVNGDTAHLAGHHVELVRADNPMVRAAGVIDEGGRFSVDTLDAGRRLEGAREGTYRARLILNDEGDGRSKPKVPKKYLDTNTSGWTVQVPAPGDVTLTVTTK